MRDISSWGQQLRKSLRQSDELNNYVTISLPNENQATRKREASRLAQLIVEVELGLSLLREITSQEPAKSVSTLLLGYRFPHPALEDEKNWSLVQNARFYLVRRKGRQWERSLSRYIELPETIRIFHLATPTDIPELIPTTIEPRRLQLYQQTLSITPQHKPRKFELATEGYWYTKISPKGHSSVEIPIYIPEAVANLARSPQVAFHRLRTAINPSQTVSLDRLKQKAQEMDSKLEEAGQEPENYSQRLSAIALQLYDSNSNDFQPRNELTLDKLVHIVGLLNVGKSTLLEILIYHLAKQGYRCALLVNDVVTQVRLASLFAHRLNIPAVPILGRDRASHLDKVYEPILANEGKEITQGAMHPAWRWFSFVCPLLALVQSEEKWEFGHEPCHNLYSKKSSANEEDNEDLDELENPKTITCPLYYQCPRHQLEQDIANAKVWILTPGSLIHSHVPRQLFQESMTFGEAVYQECHFLFVDEADRVQVQLDEAFSPSQILVDNSGNSLLNKLGLIFANTNYTSDRRGMGKRLFSEVKRAQDYAQVALEIILPRLHNQPELVEWLGSNPFTGRSLFSKIIRELLALSSEENYTLSQPKTKLTRAQRVRQRTQQIVQGLPTEEERQRRQQFLKTLQGFWEAPLNPRQGGELSNVALRILAFDNEREALIEVNEWLQRWLKNFNISLKDKNQLEELTRNVHLAILVTVLDDRLGFLVDNLTTLVRMRIVDFHDVSQTLVYRPPRDFLPIIPSAPVGNILGFQYKKERGKPGGQLEYFRYVGVGRALLLNFPTLFRVDSWEGPHTVLISGTSYVPGSPSYHIRQHPTVLLEPNSNNSAVGDAGISESEFFFHPQCRNDGSYIALSGLPPKERKKAANDLVKAICDRPGKAPSFLDRLFQTLEDKQGLDSLQWQDRKRLLLITNSYDEAEFVERVLKPLYRAEDINADAIVTLRRDNAPVHLSGIRRGQIRDIKDLPVRIVIAPLMALERGHNILNDQRKAAFGAAIFLTRPMPVPDDWQNTVVQLNNWALEAEREFSLYQPILNRGEPLTLTNIEREFYKYAVAKMLELNCRAMSFKQLNDEERQVLCWNQLVTIWQVVGRLVRGGVPCIVHFLDVKFAPQSAKGEWDTQHSSLLVGILQQLQQAIEDRNLSPYERTLMQSLYGPFFHALKNTKELNHGL
ncbi:MAG: hypothetical protein SAJ12_06570 [Jaaginema sp. PMC 1079.18]|nr:hypothetical protein [Jaaginema sp. PMC 1080.18]MEC4850657.1 hypothetical protein [Jaaginema sp. PMC 1079.18]MEC4866667.1 hypothetical protein [Jaaginema sp. PMC 1078.18]